jgi:hypothetical protein
MQPVREDSLVSTRDEETFTILCDYLGVAQLPDLFVKCYRQIKYKRDLHAGAGGWRPTRSEVGIIADLTGVHSGKPMIPVEEWDDDLKSEDADNWLVLGESVVVTIGRREVDAKYLGEVDGDSNRVRLRLQDGSEKTTWKSRVRSKHEMAPAAGPDLVLAR